MGTRGAIGFVIDGVEKITYNHFDSYPSGLGEHVLNFLKKGNLAEVREQVRRLEVVDGDSTPTSEQVEKLMPYADLNVSTRSLDEWYVLLRETQGEPELILKSGFLIDASDFPMDSLWCEWAYVMDFDNNVLEVYTGFQDVPHEAGRFALRSGVDNGYSPVKLIRTYEFGALPESFDQLEEELEED